MSYSSRISASEALDLSMSLAVLVIAFSILGERRVPGLEVIFVSVVGVGSGFLLHELAHKFVAQMHGYQAEYRANRSGLVFILIMAFVGFIFAAPGAVMIHKELRENPFSSTGYLQDDILKKARREQLLISIAGPMTNIVLAVLFFTVLAGGLTNSSLLENAASYAFFINVYLAGFNLLPFGPLDGKKVFESNSLVWAVVAVPTILVALSLVLGLGVI